MDGIIIIKECTEISTIGCIMIIVLFTIAMVLSIGLYKIGDVLEEKCNDTYGYICTVLSLAFFIAGIFTIKVIPNFDEFQEPNGKYEVTVSSNVDMDEFQSQYTIIDYENGVYTVKPKDNIPQ